MKHKCLEVGCNNIVSRGGNRCRSCSKKGELNSQYKEKIKVICNYCGKEFFKYPAYVKKRNFCCRECANKGHSLYLKSLPKVIKEKAKCIICGAELSAKHCKHCKKCLHNFIFVGLSAPNYIDGRSFLPYSEKFNSELKAKIRARDNYTCQNCGMTEEEHLIVYGVYLTVHHIDYNKKNCEETNLISTCIPCNSRANSNRDYWQEFYQNKISMGIQNEIQRS